MQSPPLAHAAAFASPLLQMRGGAVTAEISAAGARRAAAHITGASRRHGGESGAALVGLSACVEPPCSEMCMKLIPAQARGRGGICVDGRGA